MLMLKGENPRRGERSDSSLQSPLSPCRSFCLSNMAWFATPSGELKAQAAEKKAFSLLP